MTTAEEIREAAERSWSGHAVAGLDEVDPEVKVAHVHYVAGFEAAAAEVGRLRQSLAEAYNRSGERGRVKLARKYPAHWTPTDKFWVGIADLLGE